MEIKGVLVSDEFRAYDLYGTKDPESMGVALSVAYLIQTSENYPKVSPLMFLDKMLSKFNFKKFGASFYEIAGFTFFYDEMFSRKFTLANFSGLEEFNNKIQEIRENYNEELLEDQLSLAVNHEIKKILGDDVSENSVVYAKKWHELNNEFRKNGHSFVKFEKREEVNEKKRQAVSEYIDSIIVNLKKAKEIGFLDFLMEIHRSNPEVLNIKFHYNSGFLREMIARINSEFPEICEIMIKNL